MRATAVSMEMNVNEAPGVSELTVQLLFFLIPVYFLFFFSLLPFVLCGRSEDREEVDRRLGFTMNG